MVYSFHQRRRGAVKRAKMSKSESKAMYKLIKKIVIDKKQTFFEYFRYESAISYEIIA